LNDAKLFIPGRHGSYIFAGGRVTNGKRQKLLVEAMRHTNGGLKLIVAGPPETHEVATELQALVARHNLESKVELRLGLMTRNEIADLVCNSAACAYIPFDEDSLGYVTMEAFAAGKAVVTTSDAGGLLELVDDGVTGYVVDANARALASAFETLSREPNTALRLGKAAKERWESMKLNWPSTIEALLA
jgi:glycosyltransferase involved in cell wall biosynthesis